VTNLLLTLNRQDAKSLAGWFEQSFRERLGRENPKMREPSAHHTHEHTSYVDGLKDLNA
jgi:hypothetical protein